MFVTRENEKFIVYEPGQVLTHSHRRKTVSIVVRARLECSMQPELMAYSCLAHQHLAIPDYIVSLTSAIHHGMESAITGRSTRWTNVMIKSNLSVPLNRKPVQQEGDELTAIITFAGAFKSRNNLCYTASCFCVCVCEHIHGQWRGFGSI